MTPEEWDKVGELFHAASERPVAERSAFLDKACDGNATLRLEVESLLKANSEAHDFISEPAAGAFASGILNGDDPKAGTYFANYRIEKKIGSGGMGKVFLATDTRLDRLVAIKTLSAAFENDESFIKRFEREARAAATLNHPNVATIYSVEEIDGKPFIAMEYIDGQPLDALIPANGVDLDTFFAWFIPIADALAKAHERGVVHRDIKPGNLMIAANGTPKVLDFGLAYFDSDSTENVDGTTGLTRPGQIIGTPSYMSPEQAEGKHLDHRTDIFSLGVVMYQALTGKRPFPGDSNAEIVSNLLKTEPEPLSSVRSDIPSPITQLIAKCLSKKKSARVQDASEIAGVLSLFKPASSRGASTDSLLRRLYRETYVNSRWWLVGAGVLVIGLALAGWYYFSRAERRAISFENITLRKLSQSNNVGYTELSPDGKSIAFASFDDDGNRSLWFRRVDDRNALQIVPPQPVSYWGGLAISEDGDYVYYLTAATSATHGTLYRVSSLGGPPRKIVDTVNDVGGISPDGQRILTVRYGVPAQILSVNTSDGGGETVHASGGEGDAQTNFRDPHFSADGKSIYYIKYERIDGVEIWSLMVRPLSGGAERQILRQKDRIAELAVLRDSSGLIVTANDPSTNVQQLFHVSLPGGELTRITNDLSVYFGISVDRDGKNIVTAQRNDEFRVLVGEASNLTNLKPIVEDQNAHRNVDWTPDGRIVYDGYENNQIQIWIADADGKNVQQLTNTEHGNIEPRVSGDGRFIVFTSKRSGAYKIWRMNADGSNQVLLTDVDGVAQAPRFAADGKTVVFDWLRDDKRMLAKVPVDGGAVEAMPEYGEVTLFNAYYWAMSPDGRFIAYSIRDETEGRTKVAVRSVDSSTPAAVLPIWPSLIFKWMPDGKSLFYRERQLAYQPENVIFKVEIARPEPKVLVSADKESILDLAFSRDGKRAAIVRGQGASNAIMLTAAPKSE